VQPDSINVQKTHGVSNRTNKIIIKGLLIIVVRKLRENNWHSAHVFEMVAGIIGSNVAIHRLFQKR